MTAPQKNTNTAAEAQAKSFVCVIEPHHDRVVLDGQYVHVSYLRSLISGAQRPASDTIAPEVRSKLLKNIEELWNSLRPTRWDKVAFTVNAFFDEAIQEAGEADAETLSTIRAAIIGKLSELEEGGYTPESLHITSVISNTFRHFPAAAAREDTETPADPIWSEEDDAEQQAYFARWPDRPEDAEMPIHAETPTFKLVPVILTEEMQIAASGPLLQGVAMLKANQARWDSLLAAAPGPDPSILRHARLEIIEKCRDYFIKIAGKSQQANFAGWFSIYHKADTIDEALFPDATEVRTDPTDRANNADQ